MFSTKFSVFAICVQVLLISLICPSMAESAASTAERLLTVMPDDIVGFVTTSGADDLNPAFEKTILGRIWNDPGVQTFYQSIKKELLGKLKQEMQDPNDTRVFDTVENLVRQVLNRPIVIGAAQKNSEQGPPIYGFAILDAGTHKAEIASSLAKLEALADKGDIIEIRVGSYKMHGPKDGDVSAYWGWVGNYLVFAVNDDEGLATKYLQGKYSRLAPTYLAKAPGTGDALAVYIDFQKIGSVINTVAAQEGDEADIELIAAVMKELGLNNVKTVVARAGFLGSDVVTNGLLEVPQPRRGLFAKLKTINLSMFDMVDARAVNAAAVNCDIAGMYDTVMEAIKVASPNEAYPEIQKAIAEIESEVKFEIRRGLLENLAGPTVFYALPAGVMMEAPGGGTVVIAKLEDAALLEKTLVTLGKFAAAKSEGLLQVSSKVQNDGRTLHTWAIAPLAMMQVMPCWTVVDNHIVIASNPALSNSAIKLMTSPGPATNPIRSTEGYKKATAKLPDNLISLRYTNSKVQFNQMMTGLQQFWPMATMVAANAGLRLPFMLPSLSHIVEDMGPSCRYCWFDAEGLRSHYQGTGVEQSIGSVAGVSIAAGIMMPALARTRQIAYRVISGTNLSAIGKASLIYANDHNGKYPDNLQELIEKADLAPQCLVSKFKPKGSAEPSYIYIPGQNETMHPGNVIAYDNPKFCSDGVNVLFNDTHVQWMKPDEFLKELKATYKRLGREMPEVKFKGSRKTVPVQEVQPTPVPVEK